MQCVKEFSCRIQQLLAMFSLLAASSVLQADPATLQGNRLVVPRIDFDANCASCHGESGLDTTIQICSSYIHTVVAIS